MNLKKKIVPIVAAAITACSLNYSVPFTAEAADMELVDGLKYVNGDTNLLVFSHGTGAGSYAVLNTARMIGGTDIEEGLVVMQFSSGAFGWRNGQERVDYLESTGITRIWWDPVQDKFFLGAARRNELTDNKKELRYLAQIAMKNSNWTGLGSQVYDEWKQLLVSPILSTRNKQYRQQIYNINGHNVALQITHAGEQINKFMIIEKNKVTYMLDVPNMANSDVGSMAAIKMAGKYFFSYSYYDYTNHIGRAILLGKASDGKYKIYVDSNDYYNPYGASAFASINAMRKNGKAVNGLRFSKNGSDEKIYELIYNTSTDKVEYRE